VGSAERHARIVHKPELLRIKAELAQTAQTTARMWSASKKP
jgi:hypothetical protein